MVSANIPAMTVEARPSLFWPSAKEARGLESLVNETGTVIERVLSFGEGLLDEKQTTVSIGSMDTSSASLILRQIGKPPPLRGDDKEVILLPMQDQIRLILGTYSAAGTGTLLSIEYLSNPRLPHDLLIELGKSEDGSWSFRYGEKKDQRSKASLLNVEIKASLRGALDFIRRIGYDLNKRFGEDRFSVRELIFA